MSTEEKHKRDVQFQIEVLTKRLTELLMEDYGMTAKEALDTLYTSKTYERMEKEETGLYYQSPVYILDWLREEKQELR